MPRRLSLSCRQFRRQHAEYSDGFLTDNELRACQAHLEICPACANHDVRIRRSLLALQALPSIAPSADFGKRLSDRIRRAPFEQVPVRRHGVRWGMTGAILVASVALLVAASSRPRTSLPMRLVPVMARAPERQAVTPVHVTPAIATVAADPAARFEALPGRSPLRAAPSIMRPQAPRLQTVSYIGQ